jgi:hypothetical protein
MNDFIYWEENWNEVKMKNSTEEIKKALYKEKPVAKIIGKEGIEPNINLTYKTRLGDGTKVLFKIPEKECVDFNKEEPAQLLIRWMVNN